LIATPEHNGGYTALLKNALDWMSRPNGFPSGKVAGLVSALPGLLGGVKSQLSLQIVLNKLGVHVIPESVALGAAHQFLDAEGGLTDADVEKAVRGVGAAVAEMVTRIGTHDRGSRAA
jgi:NAD(P)H-dependent FMN reductase